MAHLLVFPSVANHTHNFPTMNFTNAQNITNHARLTRQNAMYFESDHEDDVKDAFDITKTLGDLHKLYPSVNFLRYEENLRKLRITYLATVGAFETQFFQSDVGMTEEAAILFRRYITRELRKALLVKERENMRRVKRARRVLDGSDDDWEC